MTCGVFLFDCFWLLFFSPLQATDAFHFFSSGQSKIQQGLLKEAYELISEALNLLNNVYGSMHSEIAACLRLLARLNYIMGDYPEVSLLFVCGEVGGGSCIRGLIDCCLCLKYRHSAICKETIDKWKEQ